MSNESVYQVEDYESDAIERLEQFITSLYDDKRFAIPVAEYCGPVEDNWNYIYTDRGSRLIDRMISRLYKLGEKKFGIDAMMGIDISSYLYQEL